MRAAYWAAYQAELERLDARQCKTGYGCGSSCISLAKDCQKTPKAATGKERLRRISQLAGGEIGEGKGLARLRQTEAAAKLEELQGKRSERAKELAGQRQQRQPKSDIEYYQQFRQTAEIPDEEVNWGSMRGRKNGRRPSGVVAGAMSDAPRGTKKYPDFARAKGVTPAIRDELMLLEDEDKRAVIGALQAGWSEDRAFKLVYTVGQASSPSVPAAQPTTQEPKQPGRQPAAQPKLNEQQRNRMEYINQHGGKVARGMKEAADAFRRPLSKAQRERLGANSVGGVLLKLYDKHARNRKLGLGTTELVQLQKLHEIAGTGFKGLQQDQFQGVQLVKDNAGRWQLYIDGVAKKQMELAEKAASRPGASQKKRRKAAPEPPMSEEMQRAIAHIQMHKEHLKKVNKEIRQLREKIRNATASDNVANMRLEMIKLQDRAHEHQRAMRRTKPRTDSIYQSAYESELQALRRRGA